MCAPKCPRCEGRDWKYQVSPRGTLGARIAIVPEDLRGGMVLRPIVHWASLQSIDEHYAMTVRVVDAWGHVWVEQDGEPQEGGLPTTKWQAEKNVGDQYALALPPTIPAGDYQVTVGVHISGTQNYLRALNQAGESLGEEIVLTTVRIEKDKSSRTVNDLWWMISERVTVDMGDLRMLGYAPPQSVNRGELFSIGLFWRARKKPTSDYFVAIQLRDASGQIAVEQRARPAHDQQMWMILLILMLGQNMLTRLVGKKRH